MVLYSLEIALTFPCSNVQEQAWTWMNDGNEYFYDKLEWVRVRVEGEHWNDLSPVAPSARGGETAAERKSPYSITVSFLRPYGQDFLFIPPGFNDAIWARTHRMVVSVAALLLFAYGNYTAHIKVLALGRCGLSFHVSLGLKPILERALSNLPSLQTFKVAYANLRPPCRRSPGQGLWCCMLKSGLSSDSGALYSFEVSHNRGTD